jgi:leucyl-tRNA synthetase
MSIMPPTARSLTLSSQSIPMAGWVDAKLKDLKLSGEFVLKPTDRFSVVEGAAGASGGADSQKKVKEKKMQQPKAKEVPTGKPKGAKNEAGAPPASAAAAAAGEPKSFDRRDRLLGWEAKAQQRWKENKTFEARAEPGKPKYLVTFPYPYMNGKLHLGHAYSLTKAEFMVQYQRIKGVNALWPFGFHCTGMPIQAAANRLRAEIDEFGCPPQFPAEAETPAPAPKEESAPSGEKKGKGKKTKLVAKTGNKRQWDILKMMVPEDEIASFVDPLKWLNHFPPLGKMDLENFGAGVDWRRSFVTTAVNPFYDSFIRWQFNVLKSEEKVKFGKRANIFSPLDGQVCADHDRASGEGVGPQDYTIIKLRVLELSGKLSALEGRNVFLAPATLRPETMYGQTNCFVLPEGEYGAYSVLGGDVLIMSARSARGLAHQGFAPGDWGKVECVLPKIKGWDLLGLPLSAPNAQFERVYTLPLLTISMAKGTGVVTSVPSDAPDDYVALLELANKPLYREKFNLTDDMVVPFEPVPIIEVPGYGDLCAKKVSEDLKIASTKDAEKLKQAKELVYTKGFYEGVLLVGPHKGKRVCDAKPIIRQEMIDASEAIPYLEPESTVMSRSGEECVVAFTDQWYLPYGEESWEGAVSAHVNSPSFSAYTQPALDRFNQTLGWLKEWACTRLFGLGTQLPWDEQWVIESLSDSTIYMAYYTIAHLLHGEDNLDGVSKPNPSGLKPESFTDEVWDYIFLRGGRPASCTIPGDLLDQLRGEFEYWYPMDLRCSAKDLIPNHLTMSLYNHAAVWKDRPDLWPRSFWVNGHVLVNGEKMSKSQGNFLMMDETVRRYSADATRLALANAGDTLEDANFEEKLADVSIILLTKEADWMLSMKDAFEKGELRAGPVDEAFMDRAFENEMRRVVKKAGAAYDAMLWRDGLQAGLYEMQNLRDTYREWSGKTGVLMHGKLIMRFMERQLVLLAPICPHFCENMWCEVLNRPGSIMRSSWPEDEEVDVVLSDTYQFISKSIRSFRIIQGKLKSGSKKNGVIFVSVEYEQWKKDVLIFMQGLVASGNGAFSKDWLKSLTGLAQEKQFTKKEQQGMMQFASFMKNKFEEVGLSALDTVLPIDQVAVLKENIDYVRIALEMDSIEVHELGASDAPECPAKQAQAACPGQPILHII